MNSMTFGEMHDLVAALKIQYKLHSIEDMIKFLYEHRKETITWEDEVANKEIITKIEEVDIAFHENRREYSGYSIKTTQQEILLLIESEQKCCENWGYLLSEDDLNYFIGAEFKKIEGVGYDARKVEIETDEDGESVETMFIDIVTNIGTLQFAAYNQHNGYYGHKVIVKSRDLNVKDTL